MRWFRRQEREEEAQEAPLTEEEIQAAEKAEEQQQKEIENIDEAIDEAPATEELVEEVEAGVIEEEQENIQDIYEKTEEEEPASWFTRLKQGLTKSRENIVGQISGLLNLRGTIDDELWDDIEAILIQADVGVESTMRIIDNLRDRVAKEHITEAAMIIDLLKEELENILHSTSPRSVEPKEGRAIYLIVGVNGTGKTTTIAKLARSFTKSGKSVLVGAADTFRAAAVEQLDIWAKRLRVDIVKHDRGADPAAVVYDAIHAASARKSDVLLIDTAGRLHTYVNLMEELKKIKRIADRERGDAHLETLLVIDATTGQNGIAQARLFDEALTVDGIVLTKLDGTAKGGIVLAIQDELNIPICYVGVGEGMDDLQPFKPEEFVDALVGQ
ncbi:MAG TPA: signal recognition particle-docking protein FtsY [Candidatus Aquicultor sp.]|jgi:fused signal recognition particle receptor